MTSRHLHFIGVAGAAVLVCCGQVRAGDPHGKGLEVIINTVEPEVVRGALIELSLADGAVVRTADRQLRRIPAGDLVRISSLNGPHRQGNRFLRLTLRGGDEVVGRLPASAEPTENGDALVIDAADLGHLTIPLDALARVDTARAARPEFRKVVARFDRSSVDEEDRILLTNSDVVRGFITSIGAEGVVLEASLGEANVALDRILAVRCGISESVPLPTPFFVVTLQSGGRFSTTELNWSASTVEAVLRFGQRVRMEPERIAHVDLIGGRWEWLGGHRPISYEHTPMLSLDWPYVVDRNVLGEPMKVAGEMFEHGVGVHSRSSLTYDLKGDYSEFVTSMGIDDDSGPYADVTAIILVDGKRRWFEEHVRRGTLLGPVRLDVRKAKRIELVVDFGDNGDLQDRFNWVNAALIR